MLCHHRRIQTGKLRHASTFLYRRSPTSSPSPFHLNFSIPKSKWQQSSFDKKGQVLSQERLDIGSFKTSSPKSTTTSVVVYSCTRILIKQQQIIAKAYYNLSSVVCQSCKTAKPKYYKLRVKNYFV